MAHVSYCCCQGKLNLLSQPLQLSHPATTAKNPVVRVGFRSCQFNTGGYDGA